MLKKLLHKIYVLGGVRDDASKDEKDPKKIGKKKPTKPKYDEDNKPGKVIKKGAIKKAEPKEKKVKPKVPDSVVTMDSVKKKKTGAQKDNSTQRYLPFSEIRDNIMVMKDGSLRAVIRVETINFSLKSEEEQDAIILSYQRFLNSLQFPIQILVRSLKVDIDGYIDRLKTRATNQQNQLLKEQTLRYIEFLGNLVDMAQIMKKDFYIIVPHDEAADASVRSTNLFQFVTHFWEGINQGQDTNKIKSNLARLDRMKKKVIEKTNQIRGSLEQVGLRSHLVDKEELVELLMNYYNPRLDSTAKIGEGIGHTDIEGS